MKTETDFDLLINGFVAEIFNCESTFVLDETGGIACRPLYIILIRNTVQNKTYHLKNVSFLSQYVVNEQMNEKNYWSDAEAAAQSLADKVQSRGIINMELWKLYTHPNLQ